MEIVIASSNLHKIRELRELLKPLKNLDVRSLSSFPEVKLPEEMGASFQEIASSKAFAVAKELKCLTLADDSGLVVPGLNGLPGISSRRFAGLDATESENRQKLLKDMGELQGEARNAFYSCSLVLANSQGILKSVSANCEGFILNKERGRSGFGYDSLFVKHGYVKSFGEIAESTKNRISHRSKAFEKLKAFLETLVL